MPADRRGLSMTEQNPADLHRLEHFPISFFAMIMGLSGLTLAWRKGSEVMGLSSMISDGLALFSLINFAILATIYLGKIIKHPAAVRGELKHSI